MPVMQVSAVVHPSGPASVHARPYLPSNNKWDGLALVRLVEGMRPLAGDKLTSECPS